MHPSQNQSLETRIASVICDVIPSAPKEFNENILIREDLGADSMQVIALMIAFDAEFDVEFDADAIPTTGVTMGWLRNSIAEALAAKGGN